MPELHPHWQSTEAHLTKEHAPQCAAIPVKGKRVARYPAALVGIALVCVLSFGFFRGIKDITAQLVNETTVRITENGFEPADIAVLPGTSIAWVNETLTPVILASDTLCDSNYQSCLYSTIIFEGDTWRYDVPADMPLNTQYIYTMTTGSASGTITIGTAVPAAVPAQAAIPTPAAENTVQPDLEPQTAESIPTDTAEQQTETGVLALLDALQASEDTSLPATATGTLSSSAPHAPVLTFENSSDAPEELPEALPTQANTGGVEIPRNPYTVGSTYVATPAALLPQGTAITDDNLHSGAPTPSVTTHKPVSQPETGAGIWMIALSVLCALGYLYWKKPSKAMAA